MILTFIDLRKTKGCKTEIKLHNVLRVQI